MKAFLVLLIWIVGPAAWAQVTPPGVGVDASKSLSFEAKAVSSGGATKTSLTGGGFSASSTQTHESRLNVEMRVHNFGKVPAQAHFDWFFVARESKSVRARTPAEQFVWDRGQQDMSIPAGGEQKQMLQSSGLVQVRERSVSVSVSGYSGGQPQYSNLQSSSMSGAHPYGWIVRMWDGDRLLQVQASSADLQTVGRDPALMDTLLNQKNTAIPTPKSRLGLSKSPQRGGTPPPFSSR